MTPPDIDLSAQAKREEFHQLLAIIHWRIENLAEALNIEPARARRWMGLRVPVPTRVLDWLRDLAAYHRDHDLPEGWWRTEPIPQIDEEDDAD